MYNNIIMLKFFLRCNSAVKSFVELIKYIFTIPDVKVFFSVKLCQDPLEKFFGCQRQKGGTNDNPNVQQFCYNTQTFRVVNSVCGDVRGNCRGAKRPKPIDGDKENLPLPKRAHNSNKKKEHK